MIEFMDESTGNVLGIRAAGKLSVADYREVLGPRVQSLVEHFHTIRVLFVMDATFQGWSLKAAWANTTFDLKHRRDFEKVAMVGAPTWEQWCIKAPAKLLMNGPLRTFRLDDLAQAWQWVRD